MSEHDPKALQVLTDFLLLTGADYQTAGDLLDALADEGLTVTSDAGERCSCDC